MRDRKVNAKTTYVVHGRFFVKKSRQCKYARKVCAETVTEMERQRSTHWKSSWNIRYQIHMHTRDLNFILHTFLHSKTVKDTQTHSWHLLDWTSSSCPSRMRLRQWQSFCTTSLHVLFGLPLGLETSISYSIHFFTQSVSSFRNTCPYHCNLFCCSTKIISSIPSLPLNFLLGTYLLL